MPKRTDISKIMIIGSGPIVIGQACEFDYSGTQACKALQGEGYEVVLVNSNPATIMTDPEVADRTYVEPLTKEYLEKIIALEKPQALLPTVGGQTGLNLAVELAESGILEKYGVELIGASLRAIKVAEDRLWFKDAIRKVGLDVPASALVNNAQDGLKLADQLGYPVVIRPSFTLGGTGGSIAYNREEFAESISHALEASPVHEALVEESVLGWKEYELEVMRDYRDNFVVICSIENFDPMGVHTGDSITVAPAQTLTDKEYQRMRDAAAAIIREVGVETGGSNIQFAIDPATGRMIVIEMNPRVSRSSALASKATGFPIAKIAARLAVGMTLDEIPNDITRKTPSCFDARAELAVARARGYACITAARKNCHRAPRQDSLAARGARAWHFLKGNDRADQDRSVVRSTDAGNCDDQPAARFRHHRDGSCGFAARSQAHRYERRTTGAALENHGRGGEALPYEGAHSARLQARRHLRRGI